MYINVFTAIPDSYTLSSSEIVSVNGSTQDGHCNGATLVSPGMVECPMPQTNSFLYDGVIPTLTELDGSEWASGDYSHSTHQLPLLGSLLTSLMHQTILEWRVFDW